MRKRRQNQALVLKAAILFLVLVLLALALWLYFTPKFTDLTLELGQPLPPARQFANSFAIGQPQLVTETVDLSKVGSQEIVLSHWGKKETVRLTIVDTTAPVAEFKDVYVDIHQIPKAEDFVVKAQDEDELTVSFVTVPTTPETYGKTTVEIKVSDASGNYVTGTCQLYYTWLKPDVTIELGEVLTKADLLLDPEKDADLLDEEKLEQILAAGVGKYTLESTSGGLTCICTITIADTTAPTLQLQEQTVYVGDWAGIDSFVVKAEDLGGEVSLGLLTKLDFTNPGQQTVEVQATDKSGNVTVATTTLTVVADTHGPEFSGMEDMQVHKNTNPDFVRGVKAVDAKDGPVTFTYDASRVDLQNPGLYVVIYTATDASGNTTTFRRKVEVIREQSDSEKLIASIAAGLSNDPVAIKNYVKNAIRYVGSEWGGDDPAYWGFTKKYGNCMVFAKALQALLEEKGYETLFIQVEEKYDPHGWVMVKVDGVWWHLDATPGSHQKYPGLMTDAQRHDSLWRGGIQRNWDREAYPVCNGKPAEENARCLPISRKKGEEGL